MIQIEQCKRINFKEMQHFMEDFKTIIGEKVNLNKTKKRDTKNE